MKTLLTAARGFPLQLIAELIQLLFYVIPETILFCYSVTSENARQDEIDDFKAEIDFMKTIGLHENIVTMLGCSTLYHPVCLIVEYVPHGDLLHYLRDLRKKVCKMIFMEHSIPIRTSFYSLRK